MNMVAVSASEVHVHKDGAVFVYTRAMVEQHLSEGWGERESAICEVDGVELELYPKHYKRMLGMMYNCTSECRDCYGIGGHSTYDDGELVTRICPTCKGTGQIEGSE